MSTSRLPISYMMGERRFKAGKTLALFREFNANLPKGYWDGNILIRWPSDPQVLIVARKGTNRYIFLKDLHGEWVEIEYSASLRKVVRNIRPVPEDIDIESFTTRLVIGWADIDSEDCEMKLDGDQWDISPLFTFSCGEAKYVYCNYTNERIVSCLEILPEIKLQDGTFLIDEKENVRVVCSESTSGIFIYKRDEIIVIRALNLGEEIPETATYLMQDDDFIYVISTAPKSYAEWHVGESDIGVDFIQGTLKKTTTINSTEGQTKMPVNNDGSISLEINDVVGNRYKVDIESSDFTVVDMALITKYAFENLKKENEKLSFISKCGCAWVKFNGDSSGLYHPMTTGIGGNRLIDHGAKAPEGFDEEDGSVSITLTKRITSENVTESFAARVIETWIPSVNQLVMVEGKKELFVIFDFDAVDNEFYLIEADRARSSRRLGYSPRGDISDSIKVNIDKVAPYSVPVRKNRF